MPTAAPPPPSVHDHAIARLSVEQYHAMIRSGVLTGEDRVELIDGYLVDKMPKSPRHAKAVRRLAAALRDALPDGLTAIKEDPITLAGSEPEPDVAVVTDESLDREDAHPAAADCRLVVEVAETTLAEDRGRAAVYAAAGIPEYWIVNLLTGEIERYFEPSPDGYAATASGAVADLKIDGRGRIEVNIATLVD